MIIQRIRQYVNIGGRSNKHKLVQKRNEGIKKSCYSHNQNLTDTKSFNSLFFTILFASGRVNFTSRTYGIFLVFSINSLKGISKENAFLIFIRTRLSDISFSKILCQISFDIQTDILPFNPLDFHSGRTSCAELCGEWIIRKRLMTAVLKPVRLQDSFAKSSDFLYI